MRHPGKMSHKWTDENIDLQLRGGLGKRCRSGFRGPPIGLWGWQWDHPSKPWKSTQHEQIKSDWHKRRRCPPRVWDGWLERKRRNRENKQKSRKERASRRCCVMSKCCTRFKKKQYQKSNSTWQFVGAGGNLPD